MPDDAGYFSVDDCRTIADVVRRVLGQTAKPTGASRVASSVARCAKIITCTKGTGYATAQFATGDPGGTLTVDTSLTVKVFVGKNSWWRKDDFVFIIQAAFPNLTWVVVGGVEGWVLYTPPTAGELATTQDNPTNDSYCTDSVVVP